MEQDVPKKISRADFFRFGAAAALNLADRKGVLAARTNDPIAPHSVEAAMLASKNPTAELADHLSASAMSPLMLNTEFAEPIIGIEGPIISIPDLRASREYTQAPIRLTGKSPENLDKDKTPLSPEMTKLRDKLSIEIERFEGMNAVSITDIKTGESIDINGDRPQLSACIVNLGVLLSAIDALDRGKAPYSKSEIDPFLKDMVRPSNTASAYEVVRKIGRGDIWNGARIVSSRMKRFGMEESVYDHPPGYYSPSLARERGIEDTNNYIVPNEINEIIAKAVRGELFTFGHAGKDWNDYFLEVMEDNVPYLNFANRAVPKDKATVHQKVGWFYERPNTINVSMAVIANDGSYAYTITAMHQDFDRSVTSFNELFNVKGEFLAKLVDITHNNISNRPKAE